MKILKTGALLALLSVCYLQSTAQGSAPPINEPDYNKPHFFADLPDNLPLRLADMEALFNLLPGAEVNAVIASGFTLVGSVISKSNTADVTSKSIVVKSSTRNGSTFTFTRIANTDGSFSYAGRMLSKMAGDVLVIAKEGNGYVLRKKNYYDIISE